MHLFYAIPWRLTHNTSAQHTNQEAFTGAKMDMSEGKLSSWFLLGAL